MPHNCDSLQHSMLYYTWIPVSCLLFVDPHQPGAGQYSHNHVEEENTRAENELADKVNRRKSVSYILTYLPSTHCK